MTTAQELERKFWKALESDRTLMLGIEGEAGGHTRPMTALIEDGQGPIWFFASKDDGVAARLAQGGRAFAAFQSKGHDLLATLGGPIAISHDRAMIDRLWNPFIAAWFPGGKDDPNLALLRFDADKAEIWLNEHSLVAGVKMLLGIDPRKDYADNVAKVDLR